MIPVYQATKENSTEEVIGSLVYYQSENKYYIKADDKNFYWVDVSTLKITFNNGLTWYSDFNMIDQILLSNYAK